MEDLKINKTLYELFEVLKYFTIPAKAPATYQARSQEVKNSFN